jgi:hypothetical protein
LAGHGVVDFPFLAIVALDLDFPDLLAAFGFLVGFDDFARMTLQGIRLPTNLNLL